MNSFEQFKNISSDKAEVNNKPIKSKKIKIIEENEDESETKVIIDTYIKRKETISERIKLGEYLQAVEDFKQLLASIEADLKENSPEKVRLVLSIHSNISLCYKQTEIYHQCISSCSTILDLI